MSGNTLQESFLVQPGKKRINQYPPCKNCEERGGAQGRGLCWKCFYNPEIRKRFPLNRSSTRRLGIGHGAESDYRTPSTPTDAFPGSEEKIAVLEKRLWSGEKLWHPEDRYATDPRERRREDVS